MLYSLDLHYQSANKLNGIRPRYCRAGSKLITIGNLHETKLSQQGVQFHRVLSMQSQLHSYECPAGVKLVLKSHGHSAGNDAPSNHPTIC